MPVKRKQSVARRTKISDEALMRWEQIRPRGIDKQHGDGGFVIVDEKLANALGLYHLIAYPDKIGIVETLEAAREERARAIVATGVPKPHI